MYFLRLIKHSKIKECLRVDLDYYKSILDLKYNLDDYIKKLISSGQNYSVYNQENVNVGFISLYENPCFIYLTHIVVYPNFRGIGIGKLIVSSLDKYATERNIKIIRLEARKESTLKYYIKLGFQVLETRSNSYLLEKIVNY